MIRRMTILFVIALSMCASLASAETDIGMLMVRSMPSISELPEGFKWEQRALETSGNQNSRLDIHADWTATGVVAEGENKRHQYQIIRTYEISINASFIGSLPFRELASPEAFRTHYMKYTPGDVDAAELYGLLPGGLIHVKKGDSGSWSLTRVWMTFWKSPRIWSDVRVSVQHGLKGGGYDNALAIPYIKASEAIAKDLCERLAKLVYGRLPDLGGSSETKPSVEPIVVVVHGIGFGETRSLGWSKLMSQSWGLSPLFEVTHNPADIPDSFNWIKTVRQRFEVILAQSKREKRPVIIVSHSWGSVMSKLALNGGRIEDGSHGVLVVKPMQEQGWVDQWITLGSPLQIDGQYKFFRMPTVTYGANKPPQVKRWSNFYDLEDNIGSSSGSLVDIPMNVRLQASKTAFSWYLAKIGIDPGYERWTQEQRNQNAEKFKTAQGLKIAWPHIGIWYHPTVRNYIRNQYAALKQDAEAALSNKTN